MSPLRPLTIRVVLAITSSSVLPYPDPLVTLAQREALRPQSRRLVAVTLDVPFNPAAHRIGGPVPRLNNFGASRGRPYSVLLHAICNFCVVACHWFPFATFVAASVC